MTYFENDSDWKHWYVQNNVYEQEPGLIQPDGTKKCACCKDQKYAVEYIDFIGADTNYRAEVHLGDPDLDVFRDRVLPVCNECVRMRVPKKAMKIKSDPRQGRTGRDILAMFVNVTAPCDRCGQDFTLDGLMMMTSKNQVGSRCQGCAKKQIQGAFN